MKASQPDGEREKVRHTDKKNAIREQQFHFYFSQTLMDGNGLIQMWPAIKSFCSILFEVKRCSLGSLWDNADVLSNDDRKRPGLDVHQWFRS